MPADVVSLYNTRKYRDWQEMELARYSEMPRPTPRTIASSSGFALWIELAEADEESRHRDQGKGIVASRCSNMPVIPGYIMHFDAYIWDRCGDFAMYNTDHDSKWYLDISSVGDILHGRAHSGMKVRSIPLAHGNTVHVQKCPVYGSNIEV